MLILVYLYLYIDINPFVHNVPSEFKGIVYNLQPILWPLRSPDLFPQRHVNEKESATSHRNLLDLVVHSWKNILQDAIRKLKENMPCIRKKGPQYLFVDVLKKSWAIVLAMSLCSFIQYLLNAKGSDISIMEHPTHTSNLRPIPRGFATIGIMHSTNEGKIVNDAIFGFITLKPYIVSIIDTIEFQRLRQIWQLGVTPFVYPTADHSRFEHSIGTYHLASKLITKLKQQLDKQNDKDVINGKDVISGKDVINDDDVMCVEIAALCHDIGHGPFSHVWDNLVIPEIVKPPKKIRHEQHFEKIWKTIENIEIEKTEETTRQIKNLNKPLIVNLINGKETDGKEILSNIVSNSESGMDVDKWDYLARDSMYLGHATSNYRIEIERMIHFARAIKDKDGKWKIAFRLSENLNMLRVFQLRHHLHQTAYRHKTVVAIEQMMLDGFKKYFNGRKNVEEIGTGEWILENNDSIFWQNIKDVEPFKRILQRDLYRPVCEIVKHRKLNKNEDKDMKSYLEEIKKKMPNFRFDVSSFELAKESPIPLLKIPFYKKEAPKKIFRYTIDTIPTKLQYNVDETRITIFETYSKTEVTENYLDARSELKELVKAYFDDKNKAEAYCKKCTEFMKDEVWKFEDLTAHE